MKNVDRTLTKQLKLAASSFPAIILTGSRRSGKTWLLKNLYPTATYCLFEDPDVIDRFSRDPQGFLDAITPPAIFDEIQHVPQVFNYLRSRIDAYPRRTAQWFLTGSQESALMHNVTESMAGRAAILQLLPMSHTESPKASLLLGGYPEVLARPRAASLWFASYIQSYLEKDVRSITAVQDIAKFRRFMALVAARHSQVVNKSDLAAALGMSLPGIGLWLDILEATGIILLVQPYFNNLGKRLIKSPKLYIADSGLACHLLGIDTAAELQKSPFLGALFEGFVAAEIVKAQLNAGRRRELYFFRDQQGLEVDFIVPKKGGNFQLVEVKATKTPLPDMAKPMQKLMAAWVADPTFQNSKIEAVLVHQPKADPLHVTALVPGIRALSWQHYIANEIL
jgi:uncharacterized protein